MQRFLKLMECRPEFVAPQQGNMDEAAGALAGAGDQLKEMDLNDQELQDLRDQLKRLQDAKDTC